MMSFPTTRHCDDIPSGVAVATCTRHVMRRDTASSVVVATTTGVIYITPLVSLSLFVLRTGCVLLKAAHHSAAGQNQDIARVAA